ncbi:lysophospholipid acyltransferase family protein [Planktothrix mougeotii]|uniref:1-acyl-sn-glycerol-3-phosphate acyltransferase n=1 Tax=Planktothrix mougeotii LEGE 06226 TaxID=1828728 RepID=A0ABR9U5U3_9CYAN|nr:1-acyl-sn-glycerol-3-phosphate acyltransferase [Planktothrix mougeotii]MBE9141825.1 1-acyl-sn-glycerol-3-phosphate acyltransferase [Planktothrix mougeotii LEGE 06226]
MVNLITNIQPTLDFIPPNFNPFIVKICQWGVPFWIKWKTPLVEIKGEKVERLVNLYQQFQSGKIRFLLAFRHPNTDDPFCMSQLLWRFVPETAKQQGIALSHPIHAHFMYDRGIPLWAGQFVTWLFPKLGGTSILRGKVDRLGLRSARDLFLTGQFPLAAAPEGATNGHNQSISPLEPGIAQLGFWCVEDLEKAERTEEVYLVPIGIQYFYIQDNWDGLEILISQLEKDCNLPQGTEDLTVTSLYSRLMRLGNYLLDTMENFYRQFYHRSIPQDETLDFSDRLKRLLDIALTVSEEYFNLKPTEDLSSRCRRLEQAGWDCIYRYNLKGNDNWSAVELGLADRVAIEASLRMWNMRLVESFVAVTGRYIRENPTFDRFAETTLIVWRMINQLKGNTSIKPPNLGKKRAKLTVGEPISVNQKWSDYQTNRRQAVANLTQDLQNALEQMIEH